MSYPKVLQAGKLCIMHMRSLQDLITKAAIHSPVESLAVRSYKM